MSQPSLIKKILKVTGLENCNPNYMLAAQVAIGSDPNGPPMKETWGDSSVMAMLLYLSMSYMASHHLHGKPGCLLQLQLTEVWILQGIYPLKDEWVFGCSLKTRLADQTKDSTTEVVMAK